MPLLERSKGKLNFTAAILDRWLRFVPCIMSLVALEFCFPLLGWGPLYSKIGQNIVGRCSKTWFYNLFFLSNLLKSEEICAPHTFYSSIDFQLFVVGLVACWLLYRSRRLGVAFCIAMAFLGAVHTFKVAAFYETQATAFSSDLSLP